MSITFLPTDLSTSKQIYFFDWYKGVSAASEKKHHLIDLTIVVVNFTVFSNMHHIVFVNMFEQDEEQDDWIKNL